MLLASGLLSLHASKKATDLLVDRDENLPVHNFRRIGRDPKPAGRDLSGCHVVAQAMRATGDHSAVQLACTERCAGVWAGVADRINSPIDVEIATSLPATLTAVPVPGGIWSTRAALTNSGMAMVPVLRRRSTFRLICVPVDRRVQLTGGVGGHPPKDSRVGSKGEQYPGQVVYFHACGDGYRRDLCELHRALTHNTTTQNARVTRLTINL